VRFGSLEKKVFKVGMDTERKFLVNSPSFVWRCKCVKLRHSVHRSAGGVLISQFLSVSRSSWLKRARNPLLIAQKTPS